MHHVLQMLHFFIFTKVLLLTDISVEHDGLPYCNTCNLRLFNKGPVFKKPEPTFEWVDTTPSRPIVSAVVNVDSAKCTVS